LTPHKFLRLLLQSFGVLEEVASKIRPAHLLARVTEGLRQLLTQFEEARHRVNQPTAPLQMGPSALDVLLPDATNIPQDSYDWASGMDGFSLGNYDFLSHTQMTFGFEIGQWILANTKRFIHFDSLEIDNFTLEPG
jgi:hypothetical protein